MDLIPGLPDDVARECLIRVPYNRFRVLASVCKRWKAELESPEFWVRRKASGLAEVIVVLPQVERLCRYPGSDFRLLLHGEDSGTRLRRSRIVIGSSIRFKPHSGSWSDASWIPGFDSWLSMYHELASVGPDIVFLGGRRYENTDEVPNSVWVYNYRSSRWRRGADMPGPARQDFACASDGERMVYVAGGCLPCQTEQLPERTSFKSAMAYDVKTDKWDILMPDMARERRSCKGIFQSGRFEVIGGYGSGLNDPGEKSSEAFNPITRVWEPVQEDILEVGGQPDPCARGNGSTETMYMCSNKNIVGRNASGIWRVIAELPSELFGPVHLVRWREKLMVIGCEDWNKWPFKYSAHILDLNSHEWTPTIEQHFDDRVIGACCLEI